MGAAFSAIQVYVFTLFAGVIGTAAGMYLVSTSLLDVERQEYTFSFSTGRVANYSPADQEQTVVGLVFDSAGQAVAQITRLNPAQSLGAVRQDVIGDIVSDRTLRTAGLTESSGGFGFANETLRFLADTGTTFGVGQLSAADASLLQVLPPIAEGILAIGVGDGTTSGVFGLVVPDPTATPVSPSDPTATPVSPPAPTATPVLLAPGALPAPATPSGNDSAPPPPVAPAVPAFTFTAVPTTVPIPGEAPSLPERTPSAATVVDGPTLTPTELPILEPPPTETLAPTLPSTATPTLALTPTLTPGTSTPGLTLTPTATSTATPTPTSTPLVPSQTSTPVVPTATPVTTVVGVSTSVGSASFINMSGMAPGSSVTQSLQVTNTGNVPFTTYTLSTSSDGPVSPLWNDPDGLRLRVRRGSTVLYDGPIGVNDLDLHMSVGPLGVDTLEITVSLPPTAPNALQSISQRVAFTWTVTGG